MKTLLIGIGLFLGFDLLNKYKNDLANKVKITFAGMDFDSLGWDKGVEIRLKPMYDITNNTGITARVEGFKGTILYQGKDFLPINGIEPIDVVTGKTTRLNIIVHIPIKKLETLGKDWKQLLKLGNWHLKGVITYRFGSVLYEYEFFEPFTINL